MKYKQGGFTLLELMTVLSIIAIVTTMAYPSFKETMRRNKIEAASAELLNALMLARSEAVKGNIDITLCQSTNATGCSGGSDWHLGWIIRRGPVGGAVLGAKDSAPGQIIIRSKTGSTSQSQLIYKPNGRTSSTSSQFFTICANDSAQAAKKIVIDPSGRPRVTGESVTCIQ